MSPEKVKDHGKSSQMQRAGEPAEVACFLFLASNEDSSYMADRFCIQMEERS